MKTNVIWYPHDRITCSAATMFNEMLDLYDVNHCNGFGNVPLDARGAVIVFHGQQNAQKPNIGERLTRYSKELDWVIWVSIGDEGCDFPYGDFDHRRQYLWVQTPKPGKVAADRYLIEGYHPNTRVLLARVQDSPRTLDWFFAGQINHERRQQCSDALRSVPNGLLIGTEGFMQGVSQEEYYDRMKQAKIVPCPAGPLTPDSFRFCEALEAGCIPILDAYSPDHIPNYWDMVIPGHPFRVVEDWSMLPQVMDEILADYRQNLRRAEYWWHYEKLRFRQWLKQDMDSL